MRKTVIMTTIIVLKRFVKSMDLEEGNLIAYLLA